MERRKYIGSANQNYIKSFKSKIIRLKDKDIKGYASFMKIKEVYRPYMIEDFCLYNTGYSEICFLPDGKNWCLWAIYNENGDTVEWYIDITRKNSTDEKGKPYCDDLYLDVVIMPDGRVLILDEDEIEEALNNKKITQNEFNLAYDVLENLRKDGILDVSCMKALCSKLQLLFGIQP